MGAMTRHASTSSQPICAHVEEPPVEWLVTKWCPAESVPLPVLHARPWTVAADTDRKNGRPSPPGTSNVAKILSLSVHACDSQRNTTPITQPTTGIRIPPSRSSGIVSHSSQPAAGSSIPSRSRSAAAICSGSPILSSAVMTAASEAPAGSVSSM
jgi:hypothetical protein